jgi:hypothetical protein
MSELPPGVAGPELELISFDSPEIPKEELL